MRVLLASDDETIRDKLLQVLEKRPNATFLTCSLAEAADRVLQQRPQVVVVGLSAPAEVALDKLREIQEISSARVLAVGPSSDAQLILQALQAGAYLYVDQQNIDTEVEPALRRLRLQPATDRARGRILSFCGAGGGTGVSTLVANVSTALAARGHRVGVVDLNFETGDLPALFDVTPANSLVDFSRNVARMDAEMFGRCFSDHSSGVRILAAPGTRHDAARVSVRAVRKALAMASDTFDFVVVDLPQCMRPEAVQAIYQSDTIVIVLRLDLMSLRRARRLLDTLLELKVDIERVRAVINRCQKSRELHVRDAEKTLGIPISATIPEDPGTVTRAMNQGVPLVSKWPRAAVSRRIQDMTTALNGKASPAPK